jgi:hypothetical protein
MICPYCFSNDVYYRHEVVITIDVNLSEPAAKFTNIAESLEMLLEDPDNIAGYTKVKLFGAGCNDCDAEWTL